jgi:hypothetical protein
VPKPFPVNLSLTGEEYRLLEQIAQRFGVTVEDAALAIANAEVAYRVRRKTGKTPAKVYSFKRR